MAEECVILEIENHNDAILEAFRRYYQTRKLIDCILVTTEGPPLYAHQIILSACSGFFEEIFIICGKPHQIKGIPKITLEGVSYSVLKKLLDCIYQGEIVSSTNELQPILKLARLLKITWSKQTPRDLHQPSQRASSSENVNVFRWERDSYDEMYQVVYHGASNYSFKYGKRLPLKYYVSFVDTSSEEYKSICGTRPVKGHLQAGKNSKAQVDKQEVQQEVQPFGRKILENNGSEDKDPTEDNDFKEVIQNLAQMYVGDRSTPAKKPRHDKVKSKAKAKQSMISKLKMDSKLASKVIKERSVESGEHETTSETSKGETIRDVKK